MMKFKKTSNQKKIILQSFRSEKSTIQEDNKEIEPKSLEVVVESLVNSDHSQQ